MTWFQRFFVGDASHRPKITLAQAVGLIPIVVAVLAAYGIFTPEQMQPLKDAIYAVIALFGADALLRGARNIGDGMKASADAHVAATQIAADSNAKMVAPAPQEAAPAAKK